MTAPLVTVTPTYSGCPATTVINLDIETALMEKGLSNVRLERRLSPAWTTDLAALAVGVIAVAWLLIRLDRGKQPTAKG